MLRTILGQASSATHIFDPERSLAMFRIQLSEFFMGSDIRRLISALAESPEKDPDGCQESSRKIFQWSQYKGTFPGTTVGGLVRICLVGDSSLFPGFC